MGATFPLVKTAEQIEGIRKSSQLVSATLAQVAAYVKPGNTTALLDRIAHEFIKDHSASPAFLNYNGFPYSLCISPNEQVVHGFPSEYVIKEGDLISVDCGVVLDSWYGDSAYTFSVGEVTDENKYLVNNTKECLRLAIAAAVPGAATGDIGFACAQHAARCKLGVVKELVGHGVGFALHEKPEVPNYGIPGKGVKLQVGMTLAIEPMINAGVAGVRFWKDGWTVTTKDNKCSAHFEHTVVITPTGATALSSFVEIEEVFNKHNSVSN